MDAEQSIDQVDLTRIQFTSQSLHLGNRKSFARNVANACKRHTRPTRNYNMDRGHKAYGKQWPRTFNVPRSCGDHPLCQASKDDEIAEEPNNNDSIREDDADSQSDDFLDTFFGGLAGSIPSWEAQAVEKHCLEEKRQSATICQFETWAWVDDREFPSGRNRAYPRGLSAKELREVLLRDRYGHHDLPNADRRLIYISKLTPRFLSVLAETAWGHQEEALRDAICKHIASETSFRVHIPMNGFKTYRLEFHLAYFVMRKKDTFARSSASASGTQRHPATDLSFLNPSTSSGEVPSYYMYKAHISIVVCGWSDTQWTGYAFANTGLPEEPFVEQDEEEPKQDLFAADRDDDYVQDADAPNWDARKYWLQIVAIRCELIRKEWTFLVRTIEEKVHKSREPDAYSLSFGRASVDSKDIQNSLDWTLQTMQLLRRLRDSLSLTLRAYNRFQEPSGDIRYFSSTPDYPGTPELSAIQGSIKETFEKLRDLYSSLSSLDDSCKRFAAHLGRMLSLESNRLTAASNKASIESNRLNFESFKLNEESRNLNLRTSNLNDALRELNEKATAAACANQEDAAKTSRSTRVNVELLLLTTPFGMVLQYFGSEKDIFAFNRNPKTFAMATIILMVALRIFMLLLEHTGSLLRFMLWKASARKLPTTMIANSQDSEDVSSHQSV